MRFLLLILFCQSAFGMWTNSVSTNTYDWLNNTGIPGGIPNRTTIYQTITSSDSLATLNTAIDNCPSNQVVALAAGTYTYSGTIDLDSNPGVTVRGATNANGYPTTIINSTGSPLVGSNPNGLVFSGSAGLSSGYTKGSTSVVFSATPNAQVDVGNLIQIGETDPDDFVYTASASLGQHRYSTHRVLSKSGTTVTFTPPLPVTFFSGNSPFAKYLNGGPGMRMTGIENLVLNNAGTADEVFSGWGMDSFWMKNCVVSNIVNSGVFIYGSTMCEIRHSYLGWAQDFPDNLDGFSIYLYEGTSFTRVEDNVFTKNFLAFWQTFGCAGNAFAFNYCTNAGAQSITANQLAAIRSNHGACPMVQLYEGNIGEQFHTDAYHGNDVHATVFRNWFHGLHPTATGNRIMLNLSRGSYYYEAVGNILGWSTWNPTHFEMTGQPGYSDQSVIYRMGYPGTFNNGTDPGDIDPVWPRYGESYPDAQVAATVLRHRNYDFFNDSIQNAGGQDTDLPASIVYGDTAPSYWGDRPWPPFDVTNPTLASTVNIPAGYRMANSFADPQEASGSGDATSVQGSFSASGSYSVAPQ